MTGPVVVRAARGVLTLDDIRHPKAAAQFWKKISPEPMSGCWLWTGAVAPFGYGQIRIRYILIPAHRYSYLLHKGAIPDGLFILHSCHLSACCNPDHLRVGTHAENMQDMARARRGTIGARARSARLDDEKVRAILRRLTAGEKQADIARDYDVDPGAVCEINTGKTWRHIAREVTHAGA